MRRQPYPTDLTDTDWVRLAPLLPQACQEHHPSVDLREIVNVVLYVLNGGCGGDLLPHEFPPWRVVVQVVKEWQQDGTWDQLQGALRQAGLVSSDATLSPWGRAGEPTLAA